MSLEAQARELGIPMRLDVNDELRYSYCDAHMATLVSIEGKHAIYKGQCTLQHEYEQRFEITELQAMARIENDEIVIGQSKGFVADALDEY